MKDSRPNPEDLLKEINDNTRGKLKIFFGYAAGVGKTYAMLESARVAKSAGVDVVVGYVEPHTRPDTMALLKGLERIPSREISYKGITLKEFDLDSALKRKPELIIVDELAHTNAEGMRHRKRYSDIEELLDSGIDVFTTVNVQHIESLNDIISSITNIVVKERVPDRIFNNAFQVELIDIEPLALIDRLSAGKVYKKNQAKKAMSNFFSRKNLVALRELALRLTADRVNKEVTISKSEYGSIYHTNEHILICLSSSPSNAKVIREAARMAEAFHAELTALFVETPNTKDFNDRNISILRENFKLAEDLGANIETVYGDDISYQLSEFAKVSGASKIIIGRASKGKIFTRRLGIVDKLIELAPEVDVYIIPNDEGTKYNGSYFNKIELKTRDSLKSLGILAVCIIIGYIFQYLGYSEANIITVFILGVLIISNQTKGRIYGAISSLLGVLLFNFLFTEPQFMFKVYGTEDITTFFIMLVSALVTSTLTTKVKYRANISTIIAYRTNVLLEASRELQKTNSLDNIIEKSQKLIYKLLKMPVVIYFIKDNIIEKTYNYKDENGEALDIKYTSEDEKGIVAWVVKNKKRAGANTDTLPGSKVMYVPLVAEGKVIAVVGIVCEDKSIDSSENSLFIAILNQISFAIEKFKLNESQKQALMQAENERFRANLLRAVSHDLRTPLTSISGSANSILSNNFDEKTKEELTKNIYDDSIWLINLVENILSVSRIEDGNVKLNKEPQLVEEIINEALQHVNRNIKLYKVNLSLQDEFLMVNVDVRLIIQVIINIVDNAIKYTEPGSSITIAAFVRNGQAVIEIRDTGAGISKENRDFVFDMFFTVKKNNVDSRRGLGLGLALCKSIIHAHGGEIYVKNNKPQGTIFGFTLEKVEV